MAVLVGWFAMEKRGILIKQLPPQSYRIDRHPWLAAAANSGRSPRVLENIRCTGG